MTKESGTTATSAPDLPVEPEPPATDDRTTDQPLPAPGAALLGLLSVGWLAAMLWSAQAEISSSGADSMAIISAAFALPGVIWASLVSGAAVSLTLANLLTRWDVRRPAARFAAALGAGLGTGLLAALAVTLSYGEGPAIMVLAGTTAAAATVGGIAGGLRRTLVVAAVIVASLAVFVVVFALSYYQEPLLALFDSGSTEASQVAAFRWFSRTSSLASGLAAGLLAFGYLRRAHRRTAGRAGEPPRWPGYLAAGAGPGLLLLTAELLTRTAGARVLRLAGAISEADRAAQSQLGGSRINHALLVLFVGALTALVAFGRTLGPGGESARRAPDRGSDPGLSAGPAAPGAASGPAADATEPPAEATEPPAEDPDGPPDAPADDRRPVAGAGR